MLVIDLKLQVTDYHDLHLKFDVLLLADALEKFSNISLKSYGLCTSHYLNAPGLSWDTVRKMTKVELDHFSDHDMFEKGTAGGISYISDIYSKANKKYLKSYDVKLESKHVTYL